MSKRSESLLLQDILESGEKIQRYVQGMTFEQFQSDEKTIDAVARNFEIIGEAANNLSEGTRKKIGETDWNRVKGFRNRLVHEYFGLDYSIVWNVIQNFLPKMIQAIKSLGSQE